MTASLPVPAEDASALVEQRRPFRALQHREFRFLWLAYGIGDIGFWISYISLQWQMSRVTDSNAMWLGVLFFVNFVPMLLLAPVAGVVADRVDRKGLIIVCRTIVTVLAAALAVLTGAGLGEPGVLLVFGAGFGSVFAFMAPAGQAVVANSVPMGDLASAVSLQSAGTNLSRVAGPALAAPILAAWGAGWAFGVYAASNVFVLVALLAIRITARVEEPDTGSVWRQFRAGLAHARERQPALDALVLMSVFSVFGAAHVVMYPVFATEVFDKNETAFTALVSASGAGAIIGALATSYRMTGPSLAAAAKALIGFAAAVLAFAVSRSWPLSIALAGVVGFFYFATTTTINTLLQSLAAEEKRGRIMSLFTLTWAGLVPFGGLWMGGAARVASAPVAVTIGGLVCLGYALRVLLRSSHA